ncbi:DUF6080 domain-containing protein [Paenibacillus tarimensis]|uniref:DUF6080 domain-containing protein n=1 Tax=Paenibacillus tarimensis TaxID=416012 RepID=UPI001F24FC21|nr:DUF6080 domain-containing protein [Paenibacillus tarimensis]MCF2943141.1 DUF6080 domain-containing protein [Paenibacillus tarimensis]
MSFLNELFKNKSDNRIAAALMLALAGFYFVLNMPYLLYIDQNQELLQRLSPFYGAPFSLNLFNFDPSLYYGYSNISLIHPFLSFASGTLRLAAEAGPGNWLFLVLQSLINGASAALVYYYLRTWGNAVWLPLSLALFYGISSYSLYSALIPDSYPYAQFIIVLSILYLRLRAVQPAGAVLPYALLMAGNFAVTVTNAIPYAAALLLRLYTTARGSWLYQLMRIAAVSLLFIAAGTLAQYVLFDGRTWLSAAGSNLSSGGFSYTAPFNLEQHWQVIYMLVIHPVLTPTLTLADAGIAAFATDLSSAVPWYVNLIGGLVIASAVYGILRERQLRETWMLAGYIGFAILLHIGVGFGLATFKYDLYLYAGHYIFAFFLLAGTALMRRCRSRATGVPVLLLICLLILVTAGHNILYHGDNLEQIRQANQQMAVGPISQPAAS